MVRFLINLYLLFVVTGGHAISKSATFLTVGPCLTLVQSAPNILEFFFLKIPGIEEKLLKFTGGYHTTQLTCLRLCNHFHVYLQTYFLGERGIFIDLRSYFTKVGIYFPIYNKQVKKSSLRCFIFCFKFSSLTFFVHSKCSSSFFLIRFLLYLL